MTDHPEKRKILGVYQRSAGLLHSAGSPTQFPDADYVPLIAGLGLYLPHDGQSIAGSDSGLGFEPVRSVLATTSTGFDVLITHGDIPSEDGRVFYWPSDGAQLVEGPAPCVEEDNRATVAALVNAAVLPPTGQTATDPAAVIQNRLEKTLAELEPTETSGMALKVRTGLGVGAQPATELEKSFVLTEDRNPKLYYAQNPELYYERRKHFRSKAMGWGTAAGAGVLMVADSVRNVMYRALLDEPINFELGLGAAALISAFTSGMLAIGELKEARALVPFAPRSTGFLPGYGGTRVLPSGGSRRR